MEWSNMKLVNIKKSLLLLSCLTLSSCSLLDTHQLNENAKNIIIYGDYEQVEHCRYVGELIGSEGRWFNFAFLSNTELTLASIADLKNQASELGANSIHIEEHMGFSTSVTFVGHAYNCPEK